MKYCFMVFWSTEDTILMENYGDYSLYLYLLILLQTHTQFTTKQKSQKKADTESC